MTSDSHQPDTPSETGFARPRRSFLRWLGYGLGGLLVILVLWVVFAWIGQPRDPVYEGRRLSAWMDDLVSLDPALRAAATNAITGFGTNAVPTLILHLGTPDPALGRTATDARKYLPRQLWVLSMQMTRPRAGIERRWHAATALGLLGTAATPAVPALTRATLDQDPRVSGAAIEALRAIGPAGWLALVHAMKTTNQTIFLHLCSAVARTGPDAAIVATQLVQVLSESEISKHPGLNQALTEIGAPAVPPLAELLRSERTDQRETAVSTLQAMTKDNLATLKAVSALLESEDAAVRRGAVRVLSGRTLWSRRAVLGLAGALGDPEAAVRRAALDGLADATSWTDEVTNAIPALRRFIESVSGSEREAAVATLSRVEALLAKP